MTATTTTTIQGVSVLSKEKKHGHHDVFELGLSHEGIEVRRPGRPVQQMGWDRVSEWEIEEGKDYVLLTLRGRGAATPLVVPGWTIDDLAELMQDITSHTTYEPDGSGPGPVIADGKATTAAVAASPPPPAATSSAPPAPPASSAPPASTAPTPAPARKKPPVPTRAERRQQAELEKRERRQLRVSWKPVVTVVLLGVLATAVIVVLLQSAGVIDWSFLGPVA